MTLTRRNFLASGALAVQGSMLPTGPSFSQNLSRYAVVVISGVDTQNDAGLLNDFSRIFLEKRLPICCEVDPFQLEKRGGLDASEIGSSLVELSRTSPGLFEVALRVRKTEDSARFFQMRAAARTREALAKGATSQAASQLVQRCTCIYMATEDGAFDLSAYRGAGFRVFLAPGTDEDPTAISSQFLGRDQLLIQGRSKIDPTQNISKQLSAQQSSGTSFPNVILELNVADFSGQSRSSALSSATEIAQRLVDWKHQGLTVPVRPIDLLTQSGGPAASNIVVAMDQPADGTAPTLKAFSETLKRAGIPIHDLKDKRILEKVDVTFAPKADGWIGITSDTRYQIAITEPTNVPTVLASLTSPLNDLVIQLKPEDLSTFVDRARALRMLIDLKQSGVARFHDLSSYVAHLFSPDPILENYQSMRRRFKSMPAMSLRLSAEDQIDLRSDAQLAWTFIEKYTHSKTGLCAGTVRGGEDRRINRNATLWDVASQMLGIQSAADLDIIPEAEARERLDLILKNLPSARISDSNLPPAVFSTATLRADNADFDVCDTGRFLVAVNGLVAKGSISNEQREAALKRWDLSKAFRRSKAYNFSRGKWVDSTQSFCTPYARQGFASLGETITDPIKPDPKLEGPSSDLKILYQAAKLGHFGTEPLLLSNVEGDQVAEFDVLSRVLFDAQLRWFETTGKLKCASETLLDFEPWFSYQGFRLDRHQSQAWVVATTSSAPKFKTAEFIKRAEVISSKSAYLWLAAFPHEHSKRLVTYIRKKASYPGLGFAAGVFAQTEEPMAHYSDVNTNGVILTAIVHALRG